MVVPYSFDGCPSSRPSRGGVISTSWMARPSRTHPKCHSPVCCFLTVPSRSKNVPVMSQLPTSRPNRCNLSAWPGNGPSASSASIIADTARDSFRVAMRWRLRRPRQPWLSRSCSMQGRGSVGDDGAQLVDSGPRQHVASGARRDAEDPSEARAEMAVVGEPDVERQRGQVPIALAQPLDGNAQPQPHQVMGDGLAGRRTELAGQMKRRAMNGATDRAQVPSSRRRAGQEGTDLLEARTL